MKQTFLKIKALFTTLALFAALLTTLLASLLILGCADVFTPVTGKVPAAGKGTLTLTINGSTPGKTILPTTTNPGFVAYTVTITNGATTVKEETWTSASGTIVDLDAGIYTVTVEGYTDADADPEIETLALVARGTASVTIANVPVTENVILRPVAEGTGTFSWTVRSQDGITGITMTISTTQPIIKELKAGDYYDPDIDTEELPAGVYDVTFVITDGTKTKTWVETLHIYQNQISPYDKTFSYYTYFDEQTIEDTAIASLIAAVTKEEYELGGSRISASWSDISADYFTEAKIAGVTNANYAVLTGEIDVYYSPMGTDVQGEDKAPADISDLKALVDIALIRLGWDPGANYNDTPAQMLTALHVLAQNHSSIALDQEAYDEDPGNISFIVGGRYRWIYSTSAWEVIYEDENGNYYIEQKVSPSRTEQRITGTYDKLNFERLYDNDLSEDGSGDYVELDAYKVTFYNNNWDIYPETEHVRIPDQYRPDGDSEFLSVVAIGNAFQYTYTIGGVTIPETVEYIFRDAFSGSPLRSVTIPKSVLYIRPNAFYNCTDLETVTFAEGSQLKTIGGLAFSECSNLSTIGTIPASVEFIGLFQNEYDGTWMFENPFSGPITAINVDVANPFYESHDGILYLSGLLKLDDGGYYYEINFNDPEISILHVPGALSGAVTLPSTLREYDANELRHESNGGYFDPQDNLTSIAVAPGSPYYSSQGGILYDLDKTEIMAVPRGIQGTVTIPNTVTTIYSGVFSSCALTAVTFEAGIDLQYIPSSAFFGCANLSSISIPSTVATIGSNAFGYCTSLITVSIPSSVTMIGSSAFTSCTFLTTVTFEPGSVCTALGDSAFNGCARLSSINLPDSLITIGGGSGTFRNCTALAELTIPENVTTIGAYAFNGCTGLKTLTVLAESPPTVSNLNTFYASGTTLLSIDTIKVPLDSVWDYQNATNWAAFSAKIFAIEE